MAEPFELLLRKATLPDGQLADIGMRGGRIAAIGSLTEHPARRTVDCGGRVLTPGLVDAHIHLDKALLSARAPSIEGTVTEALEVTAEAKRGFTVDDISARARRVLDAATRAGTTAMRSHVEIDPIVGLKGLDALLALKREYAPAIDLQLCAFAQEGILRSPGTEALLARALEGGADLIGGCPYNDTDAHAQIDIVFRLARDFDVDVDFHIDFFDEPDHLDVLYVAEQTVRFGWQGRVVAGHVSELAALEAERLDRVAAILKNAGIGVIILPATDLYLMGRKDVRKVRRGLAPAKRLLAAGVSVAAATNNILNAFTPMGTGDLALMGYLVTAAAHMGTESDVAHVLAMLTEHPARMLRLPDYGLHVGARADLVLWETERPAEVVTTMAPLPSELAALASLVKLELPTEADLRTLAQEVFGSLARLHQLGPPPGPDILNKIAGALRGLTLFEAERALTRAVLDDLTLGPRDIEVIAEMKKELLSRERVLDCVPQREGLDEVGGLRGLKTWLEKRGKAFTPEAKEFGIPAPRGILLLGVQGCGKSLAAKAVAKAWELPLLRLEPGRLFDKFIGESEKNLDRALATAERMAPSVLMIDEIEKGFASVVSSESDGGLSRRILGRLLGWLQDHEAPVFLVATCNQITALPPELMRKGRFDEIFFIDLPTLDERRQIFGVHLSRRHRDPALYDLVALAEAAHGFSGAEIEQGVVSALYTAFARGAELATEHILEEIKATKPLSVTRAEDVEALREWARGRAVPAA